MYETVVFLTARASEVVRRGRALAANERGQGTVEYVALVTLVALVMFGVITAMKTYKFAEGQQLALLLIKKIEEAVKQVHY